MRLTLEQLKAMDDEGLYRHWNEAEFPFDRPIGCSHCLTEHRYFQFNFPASACDLSEHVELTKNVYKFERYPNGSTLREHLEELYALRLFYDSLYPPAEAPAAPLEHRSAEPIAASAAESLGVER